MVGESTLKPVVWVGDSLRVLRTFPAPVQDEVGYGLMIKRRLKRAVEISEAGV